MFKLWLKNQINPKNIIDSPTLRRLKSYFKNPALWQFTCYSVARGASIGLFVATIPIIPFQLLLIVLLCIIFRANVPIAFTVSWVSNPITILPITYFTYRVGSKILDLTGSPLFINGDDFLSPSFSSWFSQYGVAFLIGLPVLAASAALIGYFGVIIIWRITGIMRSIKARKNKL